MTDKTLTPKQRRGVAAMLTQPTIAAAAQAAGVTERTLYRWLVLPAFTAELKAKQAGIIDAAAGRLVQGLGQALDTLAKLMTMAESESVRRAAASEWLANCLTIREQTDLERRLADLERQARA
jgi:hypothetical protein